MLPFFFTALKVGTTLAFIGAIVGEFFGGTSRGARPGRAEKIMFAGSSTLGWAGIILGATVAILAYLVGDAIERAVIPWYGSLREGSEAALVTRLTRTDSSLVATRPGVPLAHPSVRYRAAQPDRGRLRRPEEARRPASASSRGG